MAKDGGGSNVSVFAGFSTLLVILALGLGLGGATGGDEGRGRGTDDWTAGAGIPPPPPLGPGRTWVREMGSTGTTRLGFGGSGVCQETAMAMRLKWTVKETRRAHSHIGFDPEADFSDEILGILTSGPLQCRCV